MRNFFLLSVLMVFFTGGLFGQAPTVQTSAVAISNVSQTQFDINWTRGDGGFCIVVVYQGLLGTPTITDATTYTASTVFGDGSECGTGWYCVYNGTGTTATVTGLTTNSNYLVYAYEYNGAAGAEEYLTTVVSNYASSYTLPEIFNVSGGGSYCQGVAPTGVDVNLSGSENGATYQLKKDGVNEGAAVNGTGSALLWEDLSAGTYTVEATNVAGTAIQTGNAVITENVLPTVSFTGLAAGYCLDAATATLVAIPGGVFTGNGITGTDFNPADAGAGTHTITLTYTDGNGCTNTATQTVTVTDPIPQTITGTTPLCVGSTDVWTSTTPGGTWTSATPAVATVGAATGVVTAISAGTSVITYSVTVGGCENTATQTVTVTDPIPQTITGTTPICVGSTVTWTSTTAGGTWSSATPAVATVDAATGIVTGISAGTSVITYSVTVGGCINTATLDAIVNDLPAVSFTGLAAGYCVNANVATMVPSPVGATFSGNGIFGNDFDPYDAGLGTHTITLTYTDGNGCTNTTSQDVEVFGLPVVSFTGLAADYCIDAGVATLVSSPVGGTFSGNGVSGNEFDPGDAGTGTHTITLTYTDGNGCINTATQDVVVNALPAVSFTGLAAGYCINASAVTLVPTPSSGATFTGAGMTGNDFTPADAGQGTHTITLTYTDGNGCTNSASTDVTVNSLPTVTATGNSPVCEGSSLILIGNSGAVTSYAWSGPNGYTSSVQISTVSSSATNAMTGTYTLVVTDAIGCTNSATTDVIVNTTPSVIASGNSPVCEGSSLLLTGNPAAMTTYAWSGPNSFTDATQSPIVSSSATTGMTGIYTLVVTDNNGCTNSASTYVAVVALPIASATCNSPVCEGSPLNMTGGPYAMVSYVWSGPNSYSDSTQSPTISSSADSTMAGTYTLLVTDANGCSSSATTDVVVNNLFDISFTGLAQGYCIYANTSTLIPTPTGGTFAGEGITSDYFVPSDAGEGIFEITYTIIDTNGCANIARDTTEVYPIPVIPIDTVSRACNTFAILDAGSGYATYHWSNGSSAQTITATANGTYSVTVTDIHGCINNVTTELDLDSILVLVVPDSVNSCRGSNSMIIATGTAGSTFTWNSGITSDSILVSPMTEQYYYVVMNNVTNFGACMAEDSVLVIPHDPPVVTLPDTIINCGKLILDPGSGPGTYTWTGWANTPTLMVLTSGTYSVTVTNSDGCSATGTSNVTINPPVVYLGSDITIALNQTVVLGANPGYDYYSWSTGSAGYSISITGSDLGIGSHDIWCMAGLNGGCEDSDTITVNVTWASGIEENNSEGISVYPNPAHEIIFIVTENGTTPEEISVVNLLGQKVISLTQTEKVDVSSLPSGLYTLVVRYDNNKTVQKNIVVEK